jgi:CheY-like chemotaxis protein
MSMLLRAALAADPASAAPIEGFYAEGPESPTRRVFRPKGKRTILYIEDDITDVILLNAAIEDAGSSARLVAFRDPSEALLLCTSATQAPDIVVLDINMPKIGGLELLRRLKSIPLYDNTPVIILTTSNNELYRKQALENGADAYLVKPLTFDGFPAVAEKILEMAGMRPQS